MIYINVLEKTELIVLDIVNSKIKTGEKDGK